jgi:hypothetical protein
MAEEGFSQVGEFDHNDTRWRVMACRSPAARWFEIREYEPDPDDGDGDPFTMTKVMRLPEQIGQQIAETIMRNAQLPLSSSITEFEMVAETMLVLMAVRARDWREFLLQLRGITASRETTGTVIGQLASLTLSSMSEALGNEGVDEALQGWLRDITGDTEVDDDELRAFLERHSGNGGQAAS